MNDQQYKQESQKYKNKDEEEMAKLRSQMKEPGRNVTAEMNQVYQEKKNKEEEEERKFLENLRIQRERERQEMAAMGVDMESANPSKRKKSRGSAMAKGKKMSEPTMQQMTQTGEVKNSVD